MFSIKSIQLCRYFSRKSGVLRYWHSAPYLTHSKLLEDKLIRPVDRSKETEKLLRSRLVYQSRKRGILETDLILSGFAKEYLSKYNVELLKEYDNLLNEADWDILYWCTGERQAPEHWLNSRVLRDLKEYLSSKNGVVRFMPEL
ncbi:succinate dehydrogenase subunit Emi5 [Schizosaccharomyces japonicus yFS275]|uniref:Succinate dehydrogenase assembly factor 2, mitochondrial n=1 Tax=Schizosaccharomyces japonicus (strain yFS275 / FY16936) TaxID=402676 RepID=SDHF2_SCHJY|nr:succinate dehydrogenase subunit Emi5 [Schizosaccharomyces japonicus yFS275]B6JZ70.1 RecName: Full=Succinate dehydrogenase assembly factor 2, mitochondrial; Short=SDH assembly factor 2; Short=SDHAF2 [Schizosaccharomyces japonicus yFS275]EEB06838.1 succinate dehydrogenase subunit Emi5 [Schizosaccharomyces japonicus yFS275]